MFFKNFIYLIYPLAFYFTIENGYKGYVLVFGKNKRDLQNQYANFGNNRLQSQTNVSMQTETFEMPVGANTSEVDIWSRVEVGDQGVSSRRVSSQQSQEAEGGFQVLETTQTVVPETQN